MTRLIRDKCCTILPSTSLTTVYYKIGDLELHWRGENSALVYGGNHINEISSVNWRPGNLTIFFKGMKSGVAVRRPQGEVDEIHLPTLERAVAALEAYMVLDDLAQIERGPYEEPGTGQLLLWPL